MNAGTQNTNMQEITAHILADAPPPPVLKPPVADGSVLWYLGMVIGFGALASVAALLGDSSRTITPRVIFAYTMSGALAGGGVVLLLSETFGFSYFLMGVAILAGFKAVDILAIGSTFVGSLLGWFSRAFSSANNGGGTPPPDTKSGRKKP